MKKIVINVSEDTYSGIQHFCNVSNISFEMFVSHLFKIGLTSFDMCGNLVHKCAATINSSNVDNN